MIVASNLTSGSSSSTSAFTTSSISPVANALILVTLLAEGSGLGSTPTISGNGITWTQVNQQNIPVQNYFTMWRGSALSPNSGVITFTPNGASSANWLWIVDQFTGVNTTNSNGIVQSNGTSSNTTDISLSVSLSAFSNNANATYGVMGLGNTNTITSGSNFSEVKQLSALSRAIQSEFSSSNQTPVNWSFPSTSGDKDAIAVEIKAISGGNFLPFL